MNLLEAIDARHAIRAYTDEPVAADTLAALQAEIDACNAASGLHIQMAAGLDDAFLGLKTHYGRFKGVHNAIALIGRAGETGTGADGAGDDRTADESSPTTLQSFKDADGTPVSSAAAALQERVGYYGERLVLRAVQLGLATSWAVLDGAETVPSADAWWTLDAGESVVWVIAFGHGARPGGRRRTKPIEELASAANGTAAENWPDWFIHGMEAAMAAPTSLSQQPFHFTLNEDGSVTAETLAGLFAHVGLGCAKYHFAAGAAPHEVEWRAA
ncbi:nitroreductase family protein [Bifidobacterium stellenboschense]|uniref:Nitroreductase n=1 Tax=Bifidobacterium stellenboschense TaxID=762211 RepID=A0A087DJK8_9BIFI|nr:nitroreductase family protein [Bifidobacterium stellenboschense]KFI95708.1 nitroreductase [Bifidobacterium stellenboschense]